MTSKSVQDRNKQQGREEALFDQKQSPVAVTDMAPRYNTLVYNSMHEIYYMTLEIILIFDKNEGCTVVEVHIGLHYEAPRMQ